MRKLVKWNVVALGLAAGLACATGAYADTLSWAITDIGSSDTNPASGSGTLTYDSSQEYNGGYLVTSFTGTITFAGVGTGTINYTYAPPGGTTVGAPFSDPSGAFTVDDLVFPSVNSPQGAYLDVDGLLFSFSGLPGYAPSDIYNLWGNGPGNYSLYGYNGSYLFEDTVNFSDPPAVPEPPAMSLLSLGLLGLTLLLGREKLSRAAIC